MPVVRDGANLRIYNEPSVAAHYAALHHLTACERSLFDTYLRSGMDILDIGVGGGRTTPYLSGVASHYVGLDYSEEMIRICRCKFPQLEFCVADAADLSAFDDDSFDALVIAFNGLDYVLPAERREQCLRECYRVLRPGGVFIFSSHNPRAIVVRPAWSRERLRAFAAQLLGGQKKWVAPLAAVLTPAKALHSLVRATKDTVVRTAQRVPKMFFWRGEGHALDSAHGGLATHYWTPRRAIAEVSRSGFDVITFMGDDFPRTSHIFATDWYYYVFSKTRSSTSRKPCA
jgi:ubiquinone/menaquinone biosynthesis C-methylase UbiE